MIDNFLEECRSDWRNMLASIEGLESGRVHLYRGPRYVNDMTPYWIVERRRRVTELEQMFAEFECPRP